MTLVQRYLSAYNQLSASNLSSEEQRAYVGVIPCLHGLNITQPQCQPYVDMSRLFPLDWAVPICGYMLPMIVLVTVVTNSFIICILWQKHMRTPTNQVLLAMAIAELLTGLTQLPFNIYYYMMAGYEDDARYGLGGVWCLLQRHLTQILPSVLHTCTVWLTVYLSVQRYIYVCVPGAVYRYCTPKRTRQILILIPIVSVVANLHEIVSHNDHPDYNRLLNRNFCYRYWSGWVTEWLGRDRYHQFSIWFSVLVVHGLPCLLMLYFTSRLVATIQRADTRRRSWNLRATGRSADAARLRRRSTLPKTQQHQQSTSPPLGGRRRGLCRRRSSTPAGGTSTTPSSQQQQQQQRSMRSTNQMLIVVIGLFLMIEIPAAVVYLCHLVNQVFIGDHSLFDPLNKAILIRNALILLVYPFNFGIYCSMSEQFRLTVKQMFSQQVLFVPQLQASHLGGKRYSLVLVNLPRPRPTITISESRRPSPAALLAMAAVSGSSGLSAATYYSGPSSIQQMTTPPLNRRCLTVGSAPSPSAARHLPLYRQSSSRRGRPRGAGNVMAAPILSRRPRSLPSDDSSTAVSDVFRFNATMPKSYGATLAGQIRYY